MRSQGPYRTQGNDIMRHVTYLLLAILAVSLCTAAHADLQNVTVGGEVRIRANYATNTLSGPATSQARWPAAFLQARPIGIFFPPAVGAPLNGLGIFSPFDWSSRGGDFDNVEMRTRLGFRADFTNEVAAFIELDSYDIWGTDFRSDYITGTDFAANSVDDVEIYQAYIEASNMWGYPVTARVGRQELVLGSQWLVGPTDFGPFFRGLSFDAIRLTYGGESFSVDAFAAKLNERTPLEQDEDTDFYGVYASCTAVENIAFDLYWLWLRDATSVNDTNFFWFAEWLEDVFSVDDYDVTNIHTFGFRTAGNFDALDFQAEVAYQMADAPRIGSFFKPFTYGDDDFDFDVWGGWGELGYTLDMPWAPRPFIGGVYLGGEDNRDISFGEWLSPFDEPEGSYAFNRLFSNHFYTGFLDGNRDLSNAYILKAGVVAHPTETLDVLALVQYFATVDPFEAPVYITVGEFRVPVAPALSFWTEKNDDYIGTEATIAFTYHYTEDLSFYLQWSHMFTGDGLTDGNFSAGNGYIFNGGIDDEDADYVTFETRLKF